MAALLAHGFACGDPQAAIDRVAERFATAGTPRWVGVRVPAPPMRERPRALATVTSREGIAVHVVDADDLAFASRVASSFDRAIDIARTEAWPLPINDGDRGGSGSLDVYLERRSAGTQGRAYEARMDALGLLDVNDDAVGHVVVDPRYAGPTLDACTTAALLDVALLGIDPAEAEAWRRATAESYAIAVTGRACDEASIALAAAHPEAPWFGGSDGDDFPRFDSAGGAELVSLLARNSHRRAAFVLDVWNAARQRTWNGNDLRASPDLWETFEAVMGTTERKLDDAIVEACVLRFVAPPPGFPRSPLRPLGALPARARSDLAGVAPLGSLGFVVDVHDAPPRERLRVWIEGEPGVRWSLVAVRLDEHDRMLSRVVAPVLEREPRAFLTLDPIAPAYRVAVIVTNLSRARPDADVPDDRVRGFRITVDRTPG